MIKLYEECLSNVGVCIILFFFFFLHLSLLTPKVIALLFFLPFPLFFFSVHGRIKVHNILDTTLEQDNFILIFKVYLTQLNKNLIY